MTHELWARGRYLCNVFPSERPFDVLAEEQNREPQTILICVENGIRTVIGGPIDVSEPEFDYNSPDEFEDEYDFAA
jgi:hypothetical protein